MRKVRTKVTLKRLEKMETKTLRRIDALQRNLLSLRSLQIRLQASENGSKTA